MNKHYVQCVILNNAYANLLGLQKLAPTQEGRTAIYLWPSKHNNNSDNSLPKNKEAPVCSLEQFAPEVSKDQGGRCCAAKFPNRSRVSTNICTRNIHTGPRSVKNYRILGFSRAQRTKKHNEPPIVGGRFLGIIGQSEPNQIHLVFGISVKNSIAWIR